ncbi:polysaccharide biosynthesis/export family protein [Wohlfahrtiimonas chitiniclastica]|uniref:polysaccharide biosynthesis/export family protein n=1 Tax=Wohlfahrtiimonas chitiniclastica TaxID=400946 RepID=UPI001BCB37D9|nr:polysaccharide biosynthesis/export family protein [Wohlfahrtiimonas chitiniclastica]MBS7820939.1 polysaccharide biosynthesis/export family protein [Wohlfahrtiimonas chitiniclastica]
MNNLSQHGVKLACISALVLLLTGCGSVFSGAGPSKSSIINQGNKPLAQHQDGYDLLTLSADNITQFARPPEAKLKPSVIKNTIPDVKLMPGDVLKVMIADNSENSGLFAPLAQGGTVFDPVRIDAAGRVNLPYINGMTVNGMTIAQAQKAIKEGVSKYTVDPQVFISLTSELGASVLVAGDVNKPGRFSTLQGPLTVLDAINQAGGPKLEPYLVDVVVRNGRSVKKYNYQDLLAGLNFTIAPNSEVVLERARKRFVAMGAVNKTGLHDFPSMNPSLLEVLGVIGGLNEQKADVRGVFVFRMPSTHDAGSKGTPQVFHLDMQQPTSMFLAKQFLVQPEDAVYVTNAGVYEFQKMISPIVQVLVLGNAIGAVSN